MGRFIGPPGPPGPPGSAGAAGAAGPAPAYADLIAATPGGAPSVGYACQDASMASAIAATYGGVNLTSLQGITRETANPLYPGAVAAECAGNANDKAQSASLPAALVGYHGGDGGGGEDTGFAMECWLYVPAGSGKKGMGFSIGKATSAFEGYGLGVGGDDTTANATSTNRGIFNKIGVSNGPGTAGTGGFNDFFSQAMNAARCNIGIAAGWHHLAFSQAPGSDNDYSFWIDGDFFYARPGDTNHVAFTSASRVCLFNDSSVATNTPSAGLMVAHAYCYLHPLHQGDVDARIGLVQLLNAIG